MDPDYRIHQPEQILSPNYIIFRQLVIDNVDAMCRVAGDLGRLRPHCKTHKMPSVARIKLERGIHKFKVATIAEAEMMADSGAKDIFLAYNMVGPNIHRAVAFCRKYPDVSFSVTADDPQQTRLLSAAARQVGVTIGVVLDVNPGRDRTGLPPGPEAVALYRLLGDLPGIEPAGLHLYDGHQRQSDLADRRAAVNEVWQQVKALQRQLEQSGLSIPRIVCGGTPTFPVYAEMDDPVIELSPGTCIFHDTGYGKQFPDLAPFKPAALVFTRVVSRPTANRVTFDLGTKAVAADPPMGQRITLPGLPDAVQVLQNEEHLVVETESAARFKPGDWTLAIPTHICPTSMLYDSAVVIEDGEVVGEWQIPARNRVITL